jgi:SAM-dependent methyltransferase
MFRRAYYWLPPTGRRWVRRLVFLPFDLWHLATGRPQYHGIDLPLRGEVFTGGGDFLENGLIHKKLFIQLGGLLPEHDVLDIGSGLGRMAIPLTDYLLPSSQFRGFDIVPHAVKQCQDRISRVCPNFQFSHVPLRNDLYTDGGENAALFSFPYGDAQFDFALATSVFTHIGPDVVIRYLLESRRVIRKGGSAYFTFFILDEDSTANQRRDFSFKHPRHGAFYMDADVDGANVAYPWQWLQAQANDAGWSEINWHKGNWSDRPGETVDYQDILILS